MSREEKNDPVVFPPGYADKHGVPGSLESYIAQEKYLRATIAELRAEIEAMRQNARIVQTVSEITDPASAKMVQAVLIAVDRAEKAEAELADIKDAWPRIMADKCAKDEVHCTCVPALRIMVQKAEASLAEHEKREVEYLDVTHKLEASLAEKEKEAQGLRDILKRASDDMALEGMNTDYIERALCSK